MNDDDADALLCTILVMLFIGCWAGLGWGMSCPSGSTRITNPTGSGYVCTRRRY